MSILLPVGALLYTTYEMRKTTLSAEDWVHILGRVAGDIESQAGRPTGFRAVRETLAALEGDLTIDRVFQAAAKAFATAGVGTFGPLLAEMWTQAGSAFSGRTSFGADEAVWMLEAMEDVVTRQKDVNPSLRDSLSAAVRRARIRQR